MIGEAPTGPATACLGKGYGARVLRSPPTDSDRRGIGQQSVQHPPEQVACPMQPSGALVRVNTMALVRYIAPRPKSAGTRWFRSGREPTPISPLPDRD